MKRQNKKSCCLYVFGLLCFAGDEEESRILSRTQMATIGWEFSALILGDAKPDQGDDSTFFKLKLSHIDNPIAFREFLDTSLDKVVDDIQFGYYHNRAIFRFTFNPETKFHVIRSARGKIARLVREKCFDHFNGKIISEQPSEPVRTNNSLQLLHIYSHTLIVIPHGIKVLNEEIASVKNMKYDPVFTIKSTSYGFHLLGSSSNKFPAPIGIFPPKKHYVRISPPSTIVYLDGLDLDENLFTYILDAICYGGLYPKYKVDLERAKVNGKYLPHNLWSNDLMLNVFRLLTDSVGAHGFNDTSLLITQTGLIIGVLAILISIIFIR